MDFEYCIISLQTKTNRQKVVTNMKFKIGFTAEQTKNNNTMTANCERKIQTEIRRSVVQVYFPQRHMELAYYNDMFDLKNGDVGNIVCSCYCSYNCKHEFAVLLQLRNVLNLVEKIMVMILGAQNILWQLTRKRFLILPLIAKRLECFRYNNVIPSKKEPFAFLRRLLFGL